MTHIQNDTQEEEECARDEEESTETTDWALYLSMRDPPSRDDLVKKHNLLEFPSMEISGYAMIKRGEISDPNTVTNFPSNKIGLLSAFYRMCHEASINATIYGISKSLTSRIP